MPCGLDTIQPRERARARRALRLTVRHQLAAQPATLTPAAKTGARTADLELMYAFAPGSATCGRQAARMLTCGPTHSVHKTNSWPCLSAMHMLPEPAITWYYARPICRVETPRQRAAVAFVDGLACMPARYHEPASLLHSCFDCFDTVAAYSRQGIHRSGTVVPE